jgi:transglutaminase-like putative cysteine protease
MLAVGGATVLMLTDAAARPMHGLAVGPFAVAAFTLSSHHPRDLRSGALAAGTALGVLSVADDRAAVMLLCVAGLVPLTFAWMAVRELLLLDGVCSGGWAIPVSGSSPWSLTVVLRLALFTAVAALLLPSEPPPRAHTGTAASGTDTSIPGGRGIGLAGGYGDLDLRNRQTLDGQPLLEVPADSPTLWQGSWYDAYDGTTWSQPRTPGAVLEPRSLPPLSALPQGEGLSTSVETPLTVLPLAYAPGQLVAAGGTHGWIYDFGNGSVAVLGDHASPTTFAVTWADPQLVAATLSTYPVSVQDPRWLDLPAALPGRVRTLAATVTADATTVQDKVAALETYLRTHEKYSLSSPVPAPGVDAVDAFLFTDHVGFCEQFASAETVMLRSLGIPARLATGFGGEGTTGGQGRRVYRNEDAHAWVQFGEPTGQWINSDPTAGSQRAGAHGSSVLARLKALWHTLTGTATARRWTALGLVLASLLGWRLSLLLRARRRRRRTRAVSPPLPPRSEVGRAYERLLVRLGEQDRPRRPNETLRDLLMRLRAPQAEKVARLLETEWYGNGRPPTEAEVLAVVAVLDGLALEPLVGAAP